MNNTVVIRGVCFAVVSLFSTASFADLYKCTVGGKVIYQQAACAAGEEKALDDSQRRMHQREKEERLRRAEEGNRNDLLESSAIANLPANGSVDASTRNANLEKGMRAYFDRVLIDPGSVQFRDLRFFLDVPGSKLRVSGTKTSPLVDVVCGQVNSKNRMGGYVGYKSFYWDSDKREAVGALESGDLAPLMEDLARRKCAGLK